MGAIYSYGRMAELEAGNAGPANASKNQSMKYPLCLLAFSIAAFAQPDLGRVLPEQPLHVAALGDFGSGDRNQAAVAHAMAQRNREIRFDMGIGLGDNFYRCGVRSANAPLWKLRWEDLYTPLGIPFYTSLGNHDYGHPPVICPAEKASPEAEIAYSEHSKSWRMPARYYTFVAGPVRFFAIDTEGWSDEQYSWLKKKLQDTRHESGVSWRIVYGHHPMYTSGVHLNERRIGELRRELAPILKEAEVDFYIAGHDHDMEHLEAGGVEYLICGAGGAHLRAVRHAVPQSVFHATTFGFLDLVVDAHKVTAQFFDTKLNSVENPALVVSK